MMNRRKPKSCYHKFNRSNEQMYVEFISTSFDPGEFLISENI